MTVVRKRLRFSPIRIRIIRREENEFTAEILMMSFEMATFGFVNTETNAVFETVIVIVSIDMVGMPRTLAASLIVLPKDALAAKCTAHLLTSESLVGDLFGKQCHARK